MRAAVYNGVKDIRVEEVPEPKAGPGEVKIKVKYCGICGSDLHEYQHGLFPESPFGHEACGEVVEVGSGVKGYHAGDRVISFNKGAYAQYLVCPAERLLKMPPGMTWERAATVEPLSVAAYSIEKAGIRQGITALITGAGPLGLMNILGLKAAGVEKILVTEVLEIRRKKAEAMGATWTFNPLNSKVSSWAKELTSGRGVDFAFESVGVEASLKDCLTSVCFQGKVIVQGIFTDRIPIHMLGFVTRETIMMGTNSVNPSLAMSWIEEKGVKPEMMVTRTIPLEKISEAFEILTRKVKEEIKILVEP
jgi:(R,R)-butanediol dehydrogenase/meso-butanediol dehydrogenase/diacetyl reductase